MTDIAISELPEGGPIEGMELVPVVQGAQTVRVSASQLSGALSGAWELIDHIELSVDDDFVFSGLGDYETLRLTAYTIQINAGRPTLRFNGDDGSNYDVVRSNDGTLFDDLDNFPMVPTNIGSNHDMQGSWVIAKPLAGRGALISWGGSITSDNLYQGYGGRWKNTADLITGVRLFDRVHTNGYFRDGSRATLEGVRR